MKLIGELQGVVTGDVWPKTFHVGDECPPELESAARELGVLEADPAEIVVAPVPPVDTKAKTAGAPENKGGAST